MPFAIYLAVCKFFAKMQTNTALAAQYWPNTTLAATAH
jgi:hypothetical protein